MSDKPAFYDAGLVSRDGAAMLLSGDRRPHGEPKLVQGPLGSRGANNPTLSRPCRDKGHGMILDIDRLAPRDRSRPVCRAVPCQRHRRRAAGPADRRRSQGNRRRLARPPQETAGGDRGPRARWPKLPAPTPVARNATPAAERRQLTVMFVDLVGSTALSGTARSRGHARDHPGLSEYRSGRDHAVRGPRREVHGRRRARLFRLAGRMRTRPSGRCGPGSRW